MHHMTAQAFDPRDAPSAVCRQGKRRRYAYVTRATFVPPGQEKTLHMSDALHT